MNALTKVDAPKAMLLDFMADKYGLKPQEFADTVRKTCGLAKASTEEFAAFVMVAREYDLNPLLKEIYAFPAKGGGIVPIVSIDGWVNLVNSHKACDGFEFEFEHDESGALVSCTCRMYRKDRGRPVTVTEYFAECVRATEPWKMKHRMLRHKAMIQAARYAFGFSGIYDEDEGAKIAEMRDITPAAPVPPRPPVPPSTDNKPAFSGEIIDAETGEILDQRETVGETGEATDALVDEWPADTTDYFTKLDDDLAVVSDMVTLEELWTSADPMARFEGDLTNQSIAKAIRKRAEKRIGAAK